MLPAAMIPSRRLLPAGAALLLLVLALAVAASTLLVVPHSSHTTTAAPAPDPRLFLRPHTTMVRGRLAGRMPIILTMSPSIPGRNIVRVIGPRTVRWSGTPARISVVIRMPGMRMPPARASLVLKGGAFVGPLTLSMFGRYRLTLTGRVGHTRAAGSFTVELPLP